MIIDTNVYGALYRGDSNAARALRDENDIYVPIIVVGELRHGFINGSKRNDNELRFDKFLAEDGVEIIYPTVQTAQVYAELSVYCRCAGRALSHNDLWIAALAQETNQQLVTYDKDFEVFADLFGDKLIILSNA